MTNQDSWIVNIACCSRERAADKFQLKRSASEPELEPNEKEIAPVFSADLPIDSDAVHCAFIPQAVRVRRQNSSYLVVGCKSQFHTFRWPARDSQLPRDELAGLFNTNTKLPIRPRSEDNVSDGDQEFNYRWLVNTELAQDDEVENIACYCLMDQPRHDDFATGYSLLAVFLELKQEMRTCLPPRADDEVCAPIGKHEDGSPKYDDDTFDLKDDFGVPSHYFAGDGTLRVRKMASSAFEVRFYKYSKRLSNISNQNVVKEQQAATSSEGGVQEGDSAKTVTGSKDKKQNVQAEYFWRCYYRSGLPNQQEAPRRAFFMDDSCYILDAHGEIACIDLPHDQSLSIDISKRAVTGSKPINLFLYDAFIFAVCTDKIVIYTHRLEEIATVCIDSFNTHGNGTFEHVDKFSQATSVMSRWSGVFERDQSISLKKQELEKLAEDQGEAVDPMKIYGKDKPLGCRKLFSAVRNYLSKWKKLAKLFNTNN